MSGSVALPSGADHALACHGSEPTWTGSVTPASSMSAAEAAAAATVAVRAIATPSAALLRRHDDGTGSSKATESHVTPRIDVIRTNLLLPPRQCDAIACLNIGGTQPPSRWRIDV